MKLITGRALKHLKLENLYHVELEGDNLRRYQLELLKIMCDIISVCEENDLFYQLSGGNCLGAVRHKGFIPWDDDADINMFSWQFDEFVSRFTKKFGDKYCVQTCNTAEYGLVVNRVRLRNSVARTHQDIGSEEAGFFVDIFFIENVSDNAIFRELHGYLCQLFRLLLSCRKHYHDRKIMTAMAAENKDLLFTVKRKVFLGFFTSILSMRTWTRMTQWCYSLCKNKNSKYVSIPAGTNYFKEMYLRKDVAENTSADFEGFVWNIPANYDRYLRMLYGDDYMVPLPEDLREKHVYFEIKFPKLNRKDGELN